MIKKFISSKKWEIQIIIPRIMLTHSSERNLNPNRYTGLIYPTCKTLFNLYLQTHITRNILYQNHMKIVYFYCESLCLSIRVCVWKNNDWKEKYVNKKKFLKKSSVPWRAFLLVGPWFFLILNFFFVKITYAKQFRLSQSSCPLSKNILLTCSVTADN